MAKDSKISWTDHTFNPWWGCEKISPGCKNCYAATFAKRVGQDCWEKSPRRLFAPSHWEDPLKWNKQALAAGERRRVFCASMADVFEGRPELDPEVHRLLDLIHDTPHLDWQLLTKRPQNIEPVLFRVSKGTYGHEWNLRDHMPNLWLGTTVEDQIRADERIPVLIRIPAKVRFLSCEPLLEPVDLRRAFYVGAEGGIEWAGAKSQLLDWVICGGESGDGRRRFDPAWAHTLAQQCHAASVPFFMKQDGHRQPGQRGTLPDALWNLKQFPS